MRWEDERYVKLYTRDTPEEVALGWEALALWRELLRKFDRAGILELGKTGIRGLAALTRIPLEVVERSLPLLLEDGRVELHGTTLVAPNYIAANETPQSDKARQREKRERDRARAIGSERASNESQNVTAPSQNVTGSHGPSRAVTPSHGASLRADPIRSDPEREPRARAREGGPQHENPVVVALLAEMGQHAALVAASDLATCGGHAARLRLAEAIAGQLEQRQRPVAWALEALRRAVGILAAESSPRPWDGRESVVALVLSYAGNPRAPRVETSAEGPAAPKSAVFRAESRQVPPAPHPALAATQPGPGPLPAGRRRPAASEA